MRLFFTAERRYRDLRMRVATQIIRAESSEALNYWISHCNRLIALIRRSDAR